MVIIITQLGNKFPNDHWRVLVVDGGEELYHDSASSLKEAKRFLIKWLTTKKS